MNWSMGPLLATIIATERVLRRPRPTGPLPCRGDRAWVSGHHAHVQCPDVDAEFERAGRHDAIHGTGAQPALDVAPSNREIAAR